MFPLPLPPYPWFLSLLISTEFWTSNRIPRTITLTGHITPKKKHACTLSCYSVTQGVSNRIYWRSARPKSVCWFDVVCNINFSNQPISCTNSCFIISLLYASTCFEQYVLIIRWSKLYYTTSGIVTHCRLPSGAQVERLRESSLNLCSRELCTGRPPTECDDTRCCIIQFWPPDDEHIVLETCRGL